jgi:hypothetical protein
MAKQRWVRQRARTDGNHNDIVGVFKALGGSWLELSNVAGALDGVVGVAGIDQRVEIKNPLALRGKKAALQLTPAEEKEIDEWQGRKPVIVTTIDEAVELVNQLRREAHATVGNQAKKV